MKQINSTSKTYFMHEMDGSNFALIKINGSAAFNYEKSNGDRTLLDFLLLPEKDENLMLWKQIRSCQDALQYKVANQLTYAWEERGYDKFLINSIINVVRDTEILVVIGYSFPYVNRFVDKMILKSMPNLHKIYVQDPNADEIIETLRTRLSGLNKQNISMIPKTYTNQFYLPNELND